MIFAEFIVKGCPRYPKHLCSSSQVLVGYFKEITDIFFFKTFEGAEIFSIDKGDFALGGQKVSEIFGQVANVNKIFFAEERGAFEDIF